MLVRRLRVESETRHLASVRAFVEGAAREAGIEAAERRRLVLAVDEAVANIMEHGYLGAAGRPIEVEVAIAPPKIEVRIRDEGPVFDAAQAARRARAPAPDPRGRFRARGYGLLLIQRLVDEVRYDRRFEGINELTLVRVLDGGGSKVPRAAP
jgi:anti-sigma regulatory factor (Ser/Thr protein kinase)